MDISCPPNTLMKIFSKQFRVLELVCYNSVVRKGVQIWQQCMQLQSNPMPNGTDFTWKQTNCHTIWLGCSILGSLCVCVCVCVREREGERESGGIKAHHQL